MGADLNQRISGKLVFSGKNDVYFPVAIHNFVCADELCEMQEFLMMLPRDFILDTPSINCPPSRLPRLEAEMRRGLDLAGSLIVVALCAPILLCTALAVRLSSPGPVFYRQTRVGREGRLFLIWKFRTMAAATQAAPLVTALDDARVTPLGRRLRSWKLDELPQLFNVIKGDMSLVGPRPQVPRFVDCFDGSLRRIVLSVRPGMTGPTALYFRHEEYLLAGRTDRERFYVTHLLPVKLRMDADYVRTRSLASDGRILADTLHLVLSRLTGRVGRSGIPAACEMADVIGDADTQAASAQAMEPAHAAAVS